MNRAGLSLPECLDKDLRFAVIDDGFGYYYKIYLKLESSISCMDEFLAVNAMVDVFQATRVGGVEAERVLSYRESWMDGEPVRQMDWKIGLEQRFQEFGIGNTKLFNVDALVQHVPGTSKIRAYVYAFHGG